MLAHTSGEWISETLHLPATMRDRFDAQSVGSSQTYGRRYAMQAILGVAAEIDDDATAAVGNGSAKAAAEVADKRIAEMKARMAEQKNDPKPVSAISLPPIPSAANELYGLLKGAKRLKRKPPAKGEYLALEVVNPKDEVIKLSAFDNRKYPGGTDLFTLLEMASTGKGQVVRFKVKTVGNYINLEVPEAVGNVNFHEGVPVIQRQAGEEPNITDEEEPPPPSDEDLYR